VTIPPSKLTAARLAAAEVIIAEGLTGTNWAGRGPEWLRRAATNLKFSFDVSYHVHPKQDEQSPAAILVHVYEECGGVSVAVEPRHLGKLSTAQAAETVTQLARIAEVARKVEAAIAEALAS
jgi:hypothetical protein